MSGGTPTYRLPAETIVTRGAAIAGGGGVRSAVFHVEVEGERYMVFEERRPGGGADLACTCPARRGCEHVAAVMIHMAGRLPAAGAPDLQFPVRPERASWPSEPVASSSLTIPPPAPPDAQGGSLYDDRDRAWRVREIIVDVVRILASRGLAGGLADLRERVVLLEQELQGLAVPDVVRPSSELRTLILRGGGEPAQISMLVERLRGLLLVLTSFLEADGPGRGLETSFLGRRWAFEEVKRAEDAMLLEVARSSVLTPFGLRRNKAYCLDLLGGEMYLEISHEIPGDAQNPSVGPFPRRIHAGLMMIMPGIPPVPVRLMQYVILPPPGENDLLKLKKASLSSVQEAHDVLRATIRLVQAPYPAFVSFAPARVHASQGRAALADAEGLILRLAHRVDPYACESLALMVGSSLIHCVLGMLVWTGREVALNPLSVLVEHPRGLSLVRLR